MINTAERKSNIFTKAIVDIAEDHKRPKKFNQIEAGGSN